MKLYYFPRTRAIRPLWLLEELEQDFEAIYVDLRAGAQREPSYRALHPHAKVPLLIEDDDTPIFESSAICLYLADKYIDRGLAPALNDPKRASYYQWFAYGSATLEPAMAQFFQHVSVASQSEEDSKRAAQAKAQLEIATEVLAQTLSDQPYLLGECFSAADVMIGAILQHGMMMGLFQGSDTLRQYTAKLAERPALQRAYGYDASV